MDPIGYDAKGSMYWLFDGMMDMGGCQTAEIDHQRIDNRLYKEMPEPKKKKPKPKKKPVRKGRVGMRRSSRRAAQATPQEEEEEEDDVENWIPWQLVCVKSRLVLICLLT